MSLLTYTVPCRYISVYGVSHHIGPIGWIRVPRCTKARTHFSNRYYDWKLFLVVAFTSNLTFEGSGKTASFPISVLHRGRQHVDTIVGRCCQVPQFDGRLVGGNLQSNIRRTHKRRAVGQIPFQRAVQGVTSNDAVGHQRWQPADLVRLRGNPVGGQVSHSVRGCRNMHGRERGWGTSLVKHDRLTGQLIR